LVGGAAVQGGLEAKVSMVASGSGVALGGIRGGIIGGDTGGLVG